MAADFVNPYFWERDAVLVDTWCVRDSPRRYFFPPRAPPFPLPRFSTRKPSCLRRDILATRIQFTHKFICDYWLRAIQELQGDIGETKSAPAGFFCLTVAPFTPDEPAPEIPDLLRRIDALLAAGGDVLLFRQPELYHMTALVNRHTNAPVRFVAGLSLMIRAFEDVYGNLEGRRLEALARLFAQNVRIYVYPMTATDLREWLKSVSITGWEWSETNGWVSASQLRCAPPLGHLFAYLLASNFLVPERDGAWESRRSLCK